MQYAGRKKGFWDIEEYEYWDEVTRRWVSELPEACVVRGVPNPKRCVLCGLIQGSVRCVCRMGRSVAAAATRG